MPPITIKVLFYPYVSVGLRCRVNRSVVAGSRRFAAEGRHDR
jgi:hypothetical protein